MKKKSMIHWTPSPIRSLKDKQMHKKQKNDDSTNQTHKWLVQIWYSLLADSYKVKMAFFEARVLEQGHWSYACVFLPVNGVAHWLLGNLTHFCMS